MKTKILILFLFLSLCNGKLFAQSAGDLFSINERRDNIASELKSYVETPVVLKINSGAYSRIVTSRNDDLKLRIPVEANGYVTLDLKRFDILTPDAKIIGKTAEAETELDLKDLILSYRGTIEGIENSMVTLTFYNGMVMGIVSSNKDTYVTWQAW